MKNNQ